MCSWWLILASQYRVCTINHQCCRDWVNISRKGFQLVSNNNKKKSGGGERHWLSEINQTNPWNYSLGRPNPTKILAVKWFPTFLLLSLYSLLLWHPGAWLLLSNCYPNTTTPWLWCIKKKKFSVSSRSLASEVDLMVRLKHLNREWYRPDWTNWSDGVNGRTPTANRFTYIIRSRPHVWITRFLREATNNWNCLSW